MKANENKNNLMRIMQHRRDLEQCVEWKWLKNVE